MRTLALSGLHSTAQHSTAQHAPVNHLQHRLHGCTRLGVPPKRDARLGYAGAEGCRELSQHQDSRVSDTLDVIMGSQPAGSVWHGTQQCVEVRSKGGCCWSKFVAGTRQPTPREARRQPTPREATRQPTREEATRHLGKQPDTRHLGKHTKWPAGSLKCLGTRAGLCVLGSVCQGTCVVAGTYTTQS